MADLNDLLPEEPDAETPEVEVAETETEAVEAEAEAPEVEPEQQQEEPTEDNKQTVPLAAHLAQRDDLNAKLTAMQAKLDTMAKPEEPKAPPPPEFLDPEGAGYFQSQMAMMAANHAAEISEMKARMKHGDALVDEAMQAAQQQGVLNRFKGQPDAWGQLAQWHKAQKVAAEVGDDPVAYKEKLRAQILEEVKSELAAEQVKGTAAPSLANVSGTGTAAKPGWGGPTDLDNILG